MELVEQSAANIDWQTNGRAVCARLSPTGANGEKLLLLMSLCAPTIQTPGRVNWAPIQHDEVLLTYYTYELQFQFYL